MAYIKIFANYCLDLSSTGAFCLYVYSLLPKATSSVKVSRKSATRTRPLKSTGASPETSISRAVNPGISEKLQSNFPPEALILPPAHAVPLPPSTRCWLLKIPQKQEEKQRSQGDIPAELLPCQPFQIPPC